MNIYYVYAYLRKNTFTPYYIGKGKGQRAYNKHGRLPVPKDLSRIVILESNLTELGAFAIERRMIRWYGRKDLNTGILNNLTEGGEGASGYVHTIESRAKNSAANKGRVPWNIGQPDTLPDRTGSAHSESTKIKMRIPNTTEQNKKIGLQFSGRRHWNNGVITKFAFDCPGPTFVAGRLPFKR